MRRIDAAGVITTFAGNGTWGFAGDGGPAAAAQLGRLTDVAIAADGRLYIADKDNNCVRVVTSDGIIATFAGRCGERGFAGDYGPATAALLDRPRASRWGPGRDLHRRHLQPENSGRLS